MPSGVYKRETKLKNSGQFKKGDRPSPETEFKKGENMREKHPNWKGGIRKLTEGYITILNPDHPFCTKQGYILEHRLIMEKEIGRYLLRNEVVHHINGIKDDNRIENLQILTPFEHKALHLKYNKGFDATGRHPKTEFKKGIIPWNKGKKGYKIKKNILI